MPTEPPHFPPFPLTLYMYTFIASCSQQLPWYLSLLASASNPQAVGAAYGECDSVCKLWLVLASCCCC